MSIVASVFLWIIPLLAVAALAAGLAAFFVVRRNERRKREEFQRRQAQAAQRALEGVERARQALEAGMTPDALLTDVEEALHALGELTGQSVGEDVTARIFQRFCVGK